MTEMLETEAYDQFGVRKIYHTKSGGEEWFMNMDDLLSDPRVMNTEGENIQKKSDGSWQSNGGDNGQFRLEAWSPAYEDMEQRRAARWRDVEIQCFVKVVSKNNNENPPYAWQLYSRGGHHSTNNPCAGSAYKGRWWNTRGANSFVKEICHPAYSDNRGTVENVVSAEEGSYGNNRWYGAKLIMYNIVENGNECVKLELYVDKDVNSSDGDLIIRNNWELVTSYVDRGGWPASQDRYDQNCGGCDKRIDEILIQPGRDRRTDQPTFNRNLIALRSDNETIRWKFFSGREIDPSKPVAR